MSTQRISVIGGGLGGVISALFLSRIRGYNGGPRYKITIHETRVEILEGASIQMARLHMGGEYPLDPETSLNCVTGAFLFSQIVPASAFSTIRGIDYIVAKQNPDAAGLAATLRKQYKMNTAHYKFLYDRALNNGHTSIIGPPGQLARSLTREELTSGFVAGIHTNELGIYSAALNNLLRQLVKDSPNVQVSCEQQIQTAIPSGLGFDLLDEKGNCCFADIVVNAGWEGSYQLNRQINKKAIQPNIYLRALGVADISECKNATRPAFALLGKHGGMYSPIDENRALLYVPAKGLSHLGKWQSQVNSNERQADQTIIAEKLYHQLTKLFPHLLPMNITEIIIRPTLSFDDKLIKRRHAHPQIIAPNWYSVTPTKGTFAVWTAINLVGLLHPEALGKFDLKSNPVVPKLFHLSPVQFE